MSSLATLAAAGLNNSESNYVPQFLDMLLGTALPTAVLVTATNMDTIANLDANGFLGLANIRRKYKNGTAWYRLQLSDGEIGIGGNGVCNIAITLGAGTNGTLYINSTQKGKMILKSEKPTVRSGTTQRFTKFKTLHLYNMVDGTDILNVMRRNGHFESKLTASELEQYASFETANNGAAAATPPMRFIDNSEGLFEFADFNPGADRIVYVQRWANPSPESVQQILQN